MSTSAVQLRIEMSPLQLLKIVSTTGPEMPLQPHVVFAKNNGDFVETAGAFTLLSDDHGMSLVTRRRLVC
ncbi:hypothetical protein BOTCAL_0147g00030 [Botryotinia calthae]|uniref:Uncharacterized protein n=1 Tax=Botryotinia calthae TaxID=38488 RepID=A0A4Y8D4S0_9HELO|nr:hypothetical protein BOTCAL_0147g00030 [Botryotinia calthae]